MEDDFDPLADCPHCGAEHGYSEWESVDALYHEGLDDHVVCPSCGMPVGVEEIYPSA